MSFFGGRSVKGISNSELKNGLRSRLFGAFKGSGSTRDRKKDILDIAFRMTGDKDLGSKYGITTPEEFEAMVGGYEEKGIFSKEECQRLRDAAKDALKD